LESEIHESLKESLRDLSIESKDTALSDLIEQHKGFIASVASAAAESAIQTLLESQGVCEDRTIAPSDGTSLQRSTKSKSLASSSHWTRILAERLWQG
jgi:hypothetical protein